MVATHPNLNLECITDPSSPFIDDVARLDKELFGPHKSLTSEAFSSILSQGGVLLAHTDLTGKIVTEALLVINADPQAETALEANLPSWLAYCDGTGVAPEYRGLGLQKELLMAREKVARVSGKSAIAASVRHRNLASIRSMYSQDYVIIADAPNYYDSSPEGARIVMLKTFDIDSMPSTVVVGQEPEAIVPQEFEHKVSDTEPIVSLIVEQSDAVDPEYNQAVGKLLASEYIGLACMDLGIGQSPTPRLNAMIFGRLELLASETQENYRLRQNQIRQIL